MKGGETMKVYKTYKIRLLPTKEQEQLMWRHVGACRFIWNWALNIQETLFQQNEQKLSCFDLIKRLPSLKKEKEYEWLQDISNATLQITLRDLDKAYSSFFKGGGIPKFKKKKDKRQSFPLRNDATYFEAGVAIIPKIGKMSYRTNYIVPNKSSKIYNPRICYVNNKWILTIEIKCETQAHKQTEQSMGIDLGIKDLCNVAFGSENFVIPNINKTNQIKKKEKKLKRLQRKVSHKYCQNGSYDKTKNILKVEQQIKELYYHISCIRKNHIHQTTHMLISKHPCKVVMEDLRVRNMMKNHCLAKAIQEQCFYEFRRQMQYKCEWNGIEFVLADRFYPSSKTCSNCGNIKKDLKLSDRTYVCPECGLVIDRDYNAAINLMKYAK